MQHNYDTKLKRAKKKVKKIKDFYKHLLVYIIVNTILIFVNLGLFQNGVLNWNIPKWPMFTTPFFWGIGLFFHWLSVFYENFNFLRKWEEKKINELIKEEEEALNDLKNYK